MKNCLAAIVLFAVVAVVSAVETTVKKYVPDSAVVAAEINVGALLRNSAVQEVLNQPEYVAKRQKYETQSGVQLTELKTVWFFVDGAGRRVALFSLKKSVDLENIFKKAAVKYRKSTIKGQTVFHVNDPELGEKSVEIAELEPGILVSGEKHAVVRYLEGKRGNADALLNVLKKTPTGSPVKVAFINTVKNMDGVVEDPVQVWLSFDFAGKTQRDMAFQSSFFCGSNKGAKMLAARFPMYVMMGATLLFNQAPELSEKIVSCIKNRVEKSDFLVNAVIPEQLGKQISDYVKQNADRLMLHKKGF
ncbi:MAG: hypothetical protein IKA32_00340 [Lentisphaeria bacterium]|nr:hypothetical protein [Lentisphaeria bacterium]